MSRVNSSLQASSYTEEKCVSQFSLWILCRFQMVLPFYLCSWFHGLCASPSNLFEFRILDGACCWRTTPSIQEYLVMSRRPHADLHFHFDDADRTFNPAEQDKGSWYRLASVPVTFSSSGGPINSLKNAKWALDLEAEIPECSVVRVGVQVEKRWGWFMLTPNYFRNFHCGITRFVLGLKAKRRFRDCC